MEKENLTLKPIDNLKTISQSLVEYLEKKFAIRFFIVAIPLPIFLKEKLSCLTLKSTQQKLNPSTDKVRFWLTSIVKKTVNWNHFGILLGFVRRFSGCLSLLWFLLKSFKTYSESFWRTKEDWSDVFLVAWVGELFTSIYTVFELESLLAFLIYILLERLHKA